MKIIKLENFKTVNFLQLPKAFFTNKIYKGISSNAKIAYTLLRDKLSISINNNWVESDGRIYVKMSRQTLMDQMNVSINTATKIFKELVEAKLIVEEDTKVKKIAKKIYICEVVGAIESKDNNKNDKKRIKHSKPLQDTEEIKEVKEKTNFTSVQAGELIKFSDTKTIIKYFRYVAAKGNKVKNKFAYTKQLILDKVDIGIKNVTHRFSTFNSYEQRKYDFDKLEAAFRGECELHEAYLY